MKTLFLSSVAVAALAFSANLMLVEKKATLSDLSVVTYNVTEDKKLEGFYTVQNKDKKLWLRGSYKNDERTGNWYCFNSDGKVFMRYNYDTKKLMTLDQDAMSRVEIRILDKNEEVASKATVPLPVCSIDQYISLVNQQVGGVFGKEKVVMAGDSPIELVAKIDEKGNASYKVEYMIGKMGYTSNFKIQESKFDIAWIPATYNGKIIPSEFRVKSTYRTDENGKGRFIWNY